MKHTNKKCDISHVRDVMYLVTKDHIEVVPT